MTRLDDTAREIEGELRAIHRALRKPLAAAIARGELTPAQRGIMQILVRTDGLSLKELSGRAGLAHSTVSGIVDRLEVRGLLARHPHPTDGRLSRISVTGAVRDFVRRELPELALAPLIEALGRAGPAGRKKIAEGLRTLRGALERLE